MRNDEGVVPYDYTHYRDVGSGALTVPYFYILVLIPYFPTVTM